MPKSTKQVKTLKQLLWNVRKGYKADFWLYLVAKYQILNDFIETILGTLPIL